MCFVRPLSIALYSSHVQLGGQPMDNSQLPHNTKPCQTKMSSSEETGHWISHKRQDPAVLASPSATSAFRADILPDVLLLRTPDTAPARALTFCLCKQNSFFPVFALVLPNCSSAEQDWFSCRFCLSFSLEQVPLESSSGLNFPAVSGGFDRHLKTQSIHC